MPSCNRHQAHLYGLDLDLPFPPPAGMSRYRAAAGQSEEIIFVDADVPLEGQTTIWEESLSGNTVRLSRTTVKSSAANNTPGLSTSLHFDQNHFDVIGKTVRYRSPDPAAAIDLYYNTLLAIVLAHNAMIALHGFVADLPSGQRIAILGQSGSGKSTLGRQLMLQGATLVSDDLVALGANALCHPGPPFFRVLEPEVGAIQDIGGKYRLSVTNNTVGARPIDLFVLLQDEATDTTPVGLAAVDKVLAHPYLPVAAIPAELPARLATVTMATSNAGCLAIRRKSMPPEDMAHQVETVCRQRLTYPAVSADR